jgi:hypothetical protein
VKKKENERNMPVSLDDIFKDDTFGLLNSKEKSDAPKTDEDRMIDSFEEINAFFEKNNREPATGSMSEYNLYARLKGFRGDDEKKRTLKPFDRFNLLGYVEIQLPSLDDLLENDDLGLLNSDADTSIYQFKHTPKKTERSVTDFVAQRQPMKEEEFAPYEQLFQQVHKELKAGIRKFADFINIEKNLQAGNYYLLDGMLLFLESADLKQKLRGKKTGGRVQLDGRTRIIFENGTKSNMLFRSLGKLIQQNGKIITVSEEHSDSAFEPQISNVAEEDKESGWIYILKSKSTSKDIVNIPHLHKIGFSKTKVVDRIKNAAKEATYLFSDVEIIASYRCYNTNTQQLENLIHRFFAETCLNVDIYDPNGQRFTPREWFCATLDQIDRAIRLMLSGDIINYKYDSRSGKIVSK